MPLQLVPSVGSDFVQRGLPLTSVPSGGAASMTGGGGCGLGTGGVGVGVGGSGDGDDAVGAAGGSSGSVLILPPHAPTLSAKNVTSARGLTGRWSRGWTACASTA